MRLVPVLLMLSIFLCFGCLGQTCQETVPYEANETYEESVPQIEKVCTNTTSILNRTDYSCTNYTTNEPYNETVCEDKQVKYTAYSIIEGKVCDATYTPDVNWDPICLRSHYDCAFRLANSDVFPGNWTVGMSVRFSNGSVADLGDKTVELRRTESIFLNWSIALGSYKDDAVCVQRIVSVPMKKECKTLLWNRTVTKQDCKPVTWAEEIKSEECKDFIMGYATVQRTRSVIKYRNVSKPC